MFSLVTTFVSETIVRPGSDKTSHCIGGPPKHMVKFGSSDVQKKVSDDFESYQAAADHFVVH